MRILITAAFLLGLPLSAQVDLDNDGLPGPWETTHFLDDNDDGSINIENGPAGDPDGDGLNNIDEFSANTDPRDDESDGDGFPDGFEAISGYDPSDADSFPSNNISEEFIGFDDFSYPNGSIAGKTGGDFWDLDNSTLNGPEFGHTGTMSDWDATTGDPQIANGSLVTIGTGVQREFNGPGEGGASNSDERFGAIANGSIFNYGAFYVQVELTRGTSTTSSGISNLDFGSEIFFFGVPETPNPASGDREFAIHNTVTNAITYSGIEALTGQSYEIVARIDYVNDIAHLYLNPDLNQAESTQTPIATAPFPYEFWTTGIRLSSGGGGATSWDNLKVASSWVDLAGPAPDAQDDVVSASLGTKLRVNATSNDLGNFHSPTLSIVTPPTFGTAQAQVDGTILYEQTSGNPTSDSLVYEIQDITGTRTDTATVTINFPGTDRYDTNYVAMPESSPATTLEIVEAFPGVTFDSPHDFCAIPGDGEKLFVTEGDGKIFLIPDVTATAPTKTEILDITSQVDHDDNELAMKGIAAHPNWASNGYIYVTYNTTSNKSRLSRFTCLTTAPYTVVGGSELILIDHKDDGDYHNIGTCKFGPDGYLYIGFGDEGTQNDGFNNSQHIDKDLWTSVIRIDVDKQPGNLEPNPDSDIPRDGSGDAYFSVPADNPFVGVTSFNGITLNASDVRTEMYVVGLRNPWQFSPEDTNNDGTVDELWVGDVGRIDKEEVGYYAAGENAGWGWREGDVAGQRDGDLLNGAPESAATLVEPIWAYNDDDGAFGGSAIIGGFIYRETALPELTGKYICADYISGNIWSVATNTAPGVEPELTLLGGEVAITAFCSDPASGEILLLDRGNIGTTQGTGSIKRLRLSTGNEGQDDGFPQTLSQTNFFADLTDLSTNPGGVAYEPNLTFWSDHAEKKRWFLINDSADTVTYSEDDPWQFPEGMVWVKHFDYATEWESFQRTINGQVVNDRKPAANSPRRRIETRFLVRNADGVYGVSYRWANVAAGSQFDASLAGNIGESLDIPITLDGTPSTIPWNIPSRNSCLTCHTPEAGHALSFNTPQLNKDGTLAGVPGNFLSRLKLTGYLPNFDEDPATLLRHVQPDETQYSLEARVRSYLAVNCSYCHQSNGSGGGNWDGRNHLKLSETGLINGAPVEAPLNPADLLVIPGNIDNSIIYNRTAAANGYSRMPPLATTVVDFAGTQLLAEWIANEAQVPQTYEDWRIANFGNATSAEGAPGEDPDGDTKTNQFEWLTNTNPNLLASAWEPTLSLSGDDVVIGVPGLAHRSVTVLHSTDLQSWSLWNAPENNRIPLNPATVHEFSSPSLPAEFFQFQIEER